MKQLENYYNLKSELYKKNLEDIKIQNELSDKINNFYDSNSNVFSDFNNTNPKYPTIYNWDVKNYYAKIKTSGVKTRRFNY